MAFSLHPLVRSSLYSSSGLVSLLLDHRLFLPIWCSRNNKNKHAGQTMRIATFAICSPISFIRRVPSNNNNSAQALIWTRTPFWCKTTLLSCSQANKQAQFLRNPLPTCIQTVPVTRSLSLRLLLPPWPDHPLSHLQLHPWCQVRPPQQSLCLRMYLPM